MSTPLHTHAEALAQSITYADNEQQSLDNADDDYVIQGSGSKHVDGSYFTVPANKSSESSPIRITLRNVNHSQEGNDPASSYLTIESGNYVVILLEGINTIVGGEREDFAANPNDGMAGIHVAQGSTVKVTSCSGDGSTDGSLEIHGGGSKYGGAGIGSKYYDHMGTVIIAGGTIKAYGAHCATGIGGGRDSEVDNVIITGGDVYAEGGDYAAGIGAGDNFSAGDGGDLFGLTISGGTIQAKGGNNGAGIGCGEGSRLRGDLSISGGTITATGGAGAAGIGGGEGGEFENDVWIRITGGTLSATGGTKGAGIGGGDDTDNVRVQVDQAADAALSITAKGGDDGAGIGSAGSGVGSSSADTMDLTLRGGTIEARGGSHGAGIGSCVDVDTILIKGSGTVNAYGGSTAAAICAGYNHEVGGKIEIIGDSSGTGNRGLSITADSGGEAAGIGSGGSANATTATVFHADVDTIFIDDSTVTATGGQYAAGIGAGCGAAMDDTTAEDEEIEHNIRITDSVITAQGGEGAAGIGGGMVGAYTRGGRSGNILLEGTSHITATGGKQGAGVGGGAGSDFQGHGGCDTVVVNLTPCENTAQGPNAIGDEGDWLIATGGLGGAGIGSGGYLFHNGGANPIPTTNDVQGIDIKGGYVKATGGGDDTDGAGINTGAGAGIGGGASGTKLKNLSISGGWVEAVAGATYDGKPADSSAVDIGHGGGANGASAADDADCVFYIAGGTLITQTISKEATKLIDGGSIRQKIDDATNSDGTSVYQTTLKTLQSTLAPVSLDTYDTSPQGYSGSGMYGDEEGKLYLYLNVTDTDQQKVTVFEKRSPDSNQTVSE